ncbi:MAG: hypothetical protein WCT05_06305 [Lentisphaeria bacterium]
MRFNFVCRELCYILFFVLLCCSFRVHALVVPPGEQSALRVQKIHSVCEAVFTRFGEQVAEASLLAEVRAKLKGQLAPPQGKALTEEDSQRLVQKTMQQRAAEAYPIPEPAKLQEMAEQAFPLYQRGDRVRILHKKNPFATTITEGILYEADNGVIKVGNKVIRLRDMLGISENAVEALKFDEKATQTRRENFIAALVEKQQAARKAWLLENKQAVEEEVLRLCGRKNEENGYTFLDDEWLSEEDLLVRVSSLSFARLSLLRKMEKEREIILAERSLEAQMQTVELSNRIAPAGTWLSPAAELNRRAKAEKERLAALAAAKEAVLKREAEEKARLAEEKSAKIRAVEAAAAHKRAEMEEQMAEINYSRGKGIPSWVIIVVVLLIVGLGVGFFLWFRKKNEDPDFKKFFEGKGKLQKEFWARVDADPEHFKYVSYLFPNMNEAGSALSKLSYILTDRDGNLSCRKKIHFGVYPHQNGAVCFVGGEKLNYALWREASAILPELPGATYFKVSTEPDVMLDLPDVDALNREGDLQVKSLGVEDLLSESGEYSRCFKYSTVNKANALAFLEKTEVKEEGIVIHVETPEGIFGKDLNGIFET